MGEVLLKSEVVTRGSLVKLPCNDPCLTDTSYGRYYNVGKGWILKNNANLDFRY